MGLVILIYRFFGKNGLYVVIVASIIAANIMVVKTVEIFGLVATLGNILYGSIFLATDILTEVYGKKAARRGVWFGFIGMALATLWMQIGLKFIPHASDFAQGSLVTIFSILPRIAAASLIAYLASQHHDIWAFLFWKKKTQGRFLWLRNNASTMVSQAIDSVIFTSIAFWGVFDTSTWLEILLSTYLLKLAIAAVDTPFLYLAKHLSRGVIKREQAAAGLD
ncbi:queuosine precursor transporter [Chloroflexota bacterium]